MLEVKKPISESKVCDYITPLSSDIFGIIQSFLAPRSIVNLRCASKSNSKRPVSNHVHRSIQVILSVKPILLNLMQDVHFPYDRIDPFVMYGLICEAQINVLQSILRSHYFEFTENETFQHTTYGFYPHKKTFINLVEMCRRLKLIIAIGKSRMYISNQNILDIFNPKLKQSVFAVRLGLIQRKLIEKNKDRPFNY
jgi:hypothetical protein